MLMWVNKACPGPCWAGPECRIFFNLVILPSSCGHRGSRPADQSDRCQTSLPALILQRSALCQAANVNLNLFLTTCLWNHRPSNVKTECQRRLLMWSVLLKNFFHHSLGENLRCDMNKDGQCVFTLQRGRQNILDRSLLLSSGDITAESSSPDWGVLQYWAKTTAV